LEANEKIKRVRARLDADYAKQCADYAKESARLSDGMAQILQASIDGNTLGSVDVSEITNSFWSNTEDL
jgi:hypothetical protein